jgi:Uncharacterised nucleotidyltransferase
VEFLFLTRCIHARLTGDLDLVERSIPAQLDWDAFLSLARKHRVAVSLATLLRQSRQVPPHIRRALHEAAVRNQQRCLLLVSELGRVIARMEKGGVELMTFKGPVLSWKAHGDVAWRQAGDLDLLVPPNKVDTADRLLSQLGYQRTVPGPLSAVQALRYRARCPHYVYFNSQQQSMIELHWRLMSNPALLPLGFEELYGRQEIVCLGNFALPTFCGADSFLHLCVHGAHHAWSFLSWIYDVAALQSGGTLDWPQIISTARRFGVERLVAQAGALCDRLLEIPMPSPVAALCEQDGRVEDLVKAALPFTLGRAVYAGRGRSRLRRLRYGLRLANGIDYWRGVVMKEIFQSAHPRFSTVPGLLLPCYVLLRPVFWVGRKFKKKLKQLRRRRSQR